MSGRLAHPTEFNATMYALDHASEHAEAQFSDLREALRTCGLDRLADRFSEILNPLVQAADAAWDSYDFEDDAPSDATERRAA